MDPVGRPVEVRVLDGCRLLLHGRDVAITSRQQRIVLACLALNTGRPVGRDELIEAVWGCAAPPSAVTALRAVVSRLRSILAPALPELGEAVPAADQGYVLRLPAEAVDAVRAERGLARFRAAVRASDLTGARSLGRGARRNRGGAQRACRPRSARARRALEGRGTRRGTARSVRGPDRGR